MCSLWNRLSNETQSEDADLDFNDAMLEWDGVNELRDCDHLHLMILSRCIMAYSSWTYDSDTNAKVLSFLESNELHGAAVMEYEDGAFGEEAADLNGGHIEVWDAANRLHVGLMEMNESNPSVRGERISGRVIQDDLFQVCAVQFAVSLSAGSLQNEQIGDALTIHFVSL